MKRCFIVSMVFIGFCSCSPVSEDFPELKEPEVITPEEVGPNEELVTFTFTTTFMAPMTRAATAITDHANRLDLWITDGTETNEAHQTSTDTGFGTITMKLDKTKTYTVYVVAHNGASAVTLEDNTISFPNNKITKSYFYTNTFSPATTTNLDCNMSRMACQFKLETTDAFPEDAGKMKFIVYGVGTTFDIENQASSNITDKETLYEKINVKEEDGTASFTVTFLADDLTETTLHNVRIQCLSKTDGSVLQEKYFTDLPFLAGNVTTCKGAFFTSGSFSMTFTAEDWDYLDVINF